VFQASSTVASRSGLAAGVVEIDQVCRLGRVGERVGDNSALLRIEFEGDRYRWSHR
jgi:hypothetical protein